MKSRNPKLVSKPMERELLTLISAVDVIEIGTVHLAITRDGVFFDRAPEVASVGTLLAFIDNARE